MATGKQVLRGDRLRAARLLRGFTQEELAELLGAGQSQINRYEKSKANPRTDILVKMSQELQVTADWLLGLVDEPTKTLAEQELSPDEFQLLSAFRKGDVKHILRIVSDDTAPDQGD